MTRLPMVNLPIEPMPPGAISEATEPICTPPEIEPPPAPLASVPPLRVTVPLPVAEPLVPLAATRMPALTIVPPL